jgi:predicted DNA binding protein
MRMDYLKLLQSLKKDLKQSNSDFKSVKFFRKDIVSVLIWFVVLEQYYNSNNNNNNIENIISEIPKEYASRPTIFKIIDDAVSKKYFEKIVDKNDKRKYNLLPTSQTLNEFEQWAKVFKGF